MGIVIDIAASLLSIGAGVYLLSKGAEPIAGVDQGQSWLEVIAHGMGAYFVAKGLWMARSLHLQAEAARRGAQLVELSAAQHAGQPESAGE